MKIFQPTLSGSVSASGSHTINGALTATTVTASTGFSGGSFTGTTVSGTTGQFTSVTASFNGNLVGIAQTASYIASASAIATFQSDVRDQLSAGSNMSYSAGAFSLSQNPSVTTITASSAYFSGDIIVNGTASIAKLNTVNQQSLVIGDKYIVILSGAADHTTLDGSGIQWGSGSTGPTVDNLGSNAHIRYASSNDTLEVYPSLSGSLTGSFNGDGTNITGISTSNITNFSTNVRSQFSAGTGIAINSGQISASSVPNSSLQNSSITILGQTVSLGGTATVNAGGILSGTLPSPTHLSSSRYGTDGVSTSYVIPLAYGGSTYTTIMAESGSSSSNATGSYLRVKAGDGAALTVSSNNPSVPNGGIIELRGGEGGNLSSSAVYLTASSGQGGDLNIYGGDAGVLQGSLINNYYTLGTASEKVTAAGFSGAGLPKIFKISDTSFVSMIATSATGAAAYYYTASGDTYGLASSTTFAISDTSSVYAEDYFELVRTSGTTYTFAFPSTSDGTKVELKQIQLSAGVWGSVGTAISVIATASTFLGIRAAANNGHFIVLYINGSNVVASLRNSSALNTAGQLSSATIATTSEIYSAVKMESIRLSAATTSTNMYVFGRAGTTLTGSINCKPLYFTSAGSTITTGSLTTVYGAYPSQINSIEIARVSSGSVANQMIMAVDGQGSSYVRFIPITAVSQSTANQSVVTGTNYTTSNDLGAYKCAATFDDEAHAYFAHGSNILSSSYILSISGSGTTASINVVDSDNTFQTSITQSAADAIVISSATKKVVTFGVKNTTTFNTVQQTYSFNNIYAQKAGDINLIGGAAQKSLNPVELLTYSTGSSINLVTGDGYLGGSINLTATSGTTSGNITLLTSGTLNGFSQGAISLTTANSSTVASNIIISTGTGSTNDGDITISAGTGSTNGSGGTQGTGNLTLSASRDVTVAGASSVIIDSRLNNGTGSYTYFGQATTPYMYANFNCVPYYASVSITITAAGSTIQASAPILYVSPDTAARTIATIEGRDVGSSPQDGQMAIIINSSATSYTLVETGNIKTSGTSATVNINGGSVTLLYSSALGKWLQIGQPAVPVAV